MNFKIIILIKPKSTPFYNYSIISQLILHKIIIKLQIKMILPQIRFYFVINNNFFLNLIKFNFKHRILFPNKT